MTSSGYLHTSGSKILNSANQEVGLSGVNWFGFETDQHAPHGLWTRNWKSVLNQIKRQGYNVIRLPFSNAMLKPGVKPAGINYAVNRDLEGLTSLQVMDGAVRYFVDGTMIAQHGGAYYPDAPVSINFNLWFIEGGLIESEGVREYQEDVDWVFHQVDTLLMPDEVEAKVLELRNASVSFEDTVPPGAIALPSLCDL